MQLGRIQNEPHAVYFGVSDKPAFGSSAIKQWILDPEVFFHEYVKQDLARNVGGPAIASGTLVDAWTANPGCKIEVISKYKTRCAAFYKEREEIEDGKVLVTPGEYQVALETYQALCASPEFKPLRDNGSHQVTYRIDRGPFYLQARVDIEVDNDAIPEAVANELQLPIESLDRLLLDNKTCASHWGKNGFKRMAMRSPLVYPIQQALYQLIVEKVLGINDDKLPFRFAAVAKDGSGVKFYDLNDIYGVARNKVVSAIGELEHRYNTNTWDDFETKCETVFIPEEFLKWAE